MASFLILRGAEVDGRDAEGRTPLVAAAFGREANVAEVLLSKGAHASTIDRTLGDEVLHYAAYSGNLAIAELLLANGADVNRRNRSNGTAPLHYAACNNDTAMIRFLAANGAQLSPVDRAGTTPRERARRQLASEAQDLLVELGAPK